MLFLGKDVFWFKVNKVIHRYLEIDGSIVAGDEPLDLGSGEQVQPFRRHHAPEPRAERGNLRLDSRVANQLIEKMQKGD